MKTPVTIIIMVLMALSIGFNVFQWVKYSEIKSVGFSDYGLPCLYSSAEKTLENGQGSAVRCDVNGKIILKN